MGGDPGNVTIMGQSGGGGKVNALLQTPAADGLYHRAVIQSGLFSGEKDLLPEQSKAFGRAVAEELGLVQETIHEIETIPYYKLARACQRAGEKLGGMRWAPVKDGEYYFGSGQINPLPGGDKAHPYAGGFCPGGV